MDKQEMDELEVRYLYSSERNVEKMPWEDYKSREIERENQRL